jgi:hypothetical protein
MYVDRVTSLLVESWTGHKSDIGNQCTARRALSLLIMRFVCYLLTKNTFLTALCIWDQLAAPILSYLYFFVKGASNLGWGHKLVCELYNSDFVLFVHRFGRTWGRLWMASRWRGHVCGATEFYFLRDSAQIILVLLPQTPLQQNGASLFSDHSQQK